MKPSEKIEIFDHEFNEWWLTHGRGSEFMDVVRQTAQLAWYAGADWALRQMKEELKHD